MKQVREALGLSYAALGHVFGYADPEGRDIRRMERGKRAIPPAVALALRYMAVYGLPDEALPETAQ